MKSFLFQIAETIKLTPDQIGVKDPVVDGDTLLTNVLNTAYLWAGVVCVIIIIVAGFYYVISNGNAAHVKRAKDAITGAIVGIVVILLAFTITQFIVGRF